MGVNWVKVYNTSAVHKAEIVKAILEGEAEIASTIINKQDSMHTHLSNGEIELYVHPENALRAKHIILKNEL